MESLLSKKKTIAFIGIGTLMLIFLIILVIFLPPLIMNTVRARVIAAMLGNCDYPVRVGLTYREKRKILNKHNELRNRVKTGNVKFGRPGPQPAAKRMPDMRWDAKLAEGMQDWLNKCIMDHDKNRNDSRFDPYGVGENIGWNAWGDMNSGYMDIIMNWFYQGAYHPSSNVEKYSDEGEARYGNYTQLVWARSTYLGCGQMLTYNWERQRYLQSFGCRYGPAGNIVGSQIYPPVKPTEKPVETTKKPVNPD